MARLTIADTFDYATAFANMMEYYYNASDAQRNAGKVWYYSARTLAESLAAHSTYTVEQTAGVISAASPQTQWTHNVDRATALVNTGTCVGLPMNRDKGKAILKNARTDAHIEAILNGSKTIAFYHNIVDPWDSHNVTLDGWMAKAGKFDAKRLSDPKIYARLEALLQAAARDLGIQEHALQATIWIGVKDRYATMTATNERKGKRGK